MRGGSEMRHNAHRLANALDNIERAHQNTGREGEKIRVLAAALNYHEGQLQDDMHDLLAYIYELERKIEGE